MFLLTCPIIARSQYWLFALETTAQIPEVEFGGKYGYVRANMNM
jgi:hypothetical protein